MIAELRVQVLPSSLRKQGPIRREFSVERWGQCPAKLERRWLWVPAFAGTTKPSPRPKLLGQHQRVAHARDVGPVAIEIGDQPFHILALHGAVE
jgi:hypothetical protein